MNSKEILNAVFHIGFLVYGVCGILGIGPVPTATVLATYMIIYYGVRYGLFDITVRKTEQEMKREIDEKAKGDKDQKSQETPGQTTV